MIIVMGELLPANRELRLQAPAQGLPSPNSTTQRVA